MTELERITLLIAYLNTLTSVSKSGVIVFEEIKRTVAEIETLLNK